MGFASYTVDEIFQFAVQLEKRIVLFKEFIATKKIYKLNPREIFNLFWAFIQTKLIYESIEKENLEKYPLTSKDIFDALNKNLPGGLNWMYNLYNEYN